MNLDEFLSAASPTEGVQLSSDDLKKLFWKFKGAVSEQERLQRFWKSTNDNLVQAYEELERRKQELVELTNELERTKNTLSAMVNSVHQGFFIFRSDGTCDDVCSKACEGLLGVNPRGHRVEQVLGGAFESRDTLLKWIQLIFENRLPFEAVAALGPALMVRKSDLDQKRVKLQYFPMHEETKLSAVVVVATDVTAEFRFQADLEAQKEYVGYVLSVLKNPSGTVEFFRSAERKLKELEELVTQQKDISSAAFKADAMMLAHTLKGGADSFHVLSLRNGLHAFEDALSNEPQDRLRLGHQLAELKSSHSSWGRELLETFGMDLQAQYLEVARDRALQFKGLLQEQALKDLDAFFTEEFLMVSMKSALASLAEYSKKLARDLGKTIEVVWGKGANLRIDPVKWSPLFENMVHLVRNTVDHGLEMPEDRIKAHKPSLGKLCFDAGLLPGGQGWYLEVTDDGRGIDKQRLREKLIQRHGTSWARASDQEVLKMIWGAQISTNTQVSQQSGRGIGMAALHRVISQLNGQVSLESNEGTGTKVRFEFLESLEA